MLRGAPASSPDRRRRAEVKTFGAPIAGWISNRALANPDGDGLPQGAALLDNFFPTATGTLMRRGKAQWALIGDSNTPVVSMFKYVVGDNSRMFGAVETTIFDITTPSGDDNLDGTPVFTGSTSGDWATVQFGTTGGTYLVGVNGESEAFVFDGTDFLPYQESDVSKLSYDAATDQFTAGQTLTGGTSGATATIYKVVQTSTTVGALWLTDIIGTFQDNEIISDGDGGSATANGTPVLAIAGITFQSPEGDGLTTADLAFPWVYKEGLYFVEKNSLRSWYLPPDSISGELKPYPLNGYFTKGGSLLWGQSWSLASSDQGGLSAQNVFTTTEGESAVFQGLSPEDTDWQMVGVYKMGNPLGKHSFIRAGGDIVSANDVGYIALSKAVQVDYAVLAPNAVSYPIEVAWNDAIIERGRNWQCELWPEGQMAIVIPQGEEFIEPVWFVSNAGTGAWGRFTGWDATCILAWNGRLFFGANDGYVYEAMVGGSDNGQPYTAVYVPLFSDCGKPTALKTARMSRCETKSRVPVKEKVSCLFDFDLGIPSAPNAAMVPIGNEWDNAIWDESVWNADRNAFVTKRRHSTSGSGYRLASCYQATSGGSIPLDVEIVTVDVTYESSDAFT